MSPPTTRSKCTSSGTARGPVWQEIGQPQRISCQTGGVAAFDVGGDGPDWYWFELWAAYPGTQPRQVSGRVSYP